MRSNLRQALFLLLFCRIACGYGLRWDEREAATVMRRFRPECQKWTLQQYQLLPAFVQQARGIPNAVIETRRMVARLVACATAAMLLFVLGQPLAAHAVVALGTAGFVQANESQGDVGTTTATFGSNIGVGHTVVALCGSGYSSDSFTLSLGNVSSWTSAVNKSGASYQTIEIDYGVSTGGTKTVKVVDGGSPITSLIVIEFSGMGQPRLRIKRVPLGRRVLRQNSSGATGTITATDIVVAAGGYVTSGIPNISAIGNPSSFTGVGTGNGVFTSGGQVLAGRIGSPGLPQPS